MPAPLTWEDEQRCAVGETIFQILPSDLLDHDRPRISTKGADFLLFKEPPLVDQYVRLLEELEPQNIVELGVMEGGGTAFLYEVARPTRIVGIDRRPSVSLRKFIERRALQETIHLHDDVDQADRRRLAEIMDADFGDAPLDLVVDDCSHLYEATRASFSELFPRLRPGGLYVIEDWPWAHEQPIADLWSDEVALTRFVFELTLSIPSTPGLISGMSIDRFSVQVSRGEAAIDPGDFDISDCADERGRSLLATDGAAGKAEPAVSES